MIPALLLIASSVSVFCWKILTKILALGPKELEDSSKSSLCPHRSHLHFLVSLYRTLLHPSDWTGCFVDSSSPSKYPTFSSFVKTATPTQDKVSLISSPQKLKLLLLTQQITNTLCPRFFSSGSIRSKSKNLPEFFTRSSSTLIKKKPFRTLDYIKCVFKMVPLLLIICQGRPYFLPTRLQSLALSCNLWTLISYCKTSTPNFYPGNGHRLKSRFDASLPHLDCQIGQNDNPHIAKKCQILAAWGRKSQPPAQCPCFVWSSSQSQRIWDTHWMPLSQQWSNIIGSSTEINKKLLSRLLLAP